MSSLNDDVVNVPPKGSTRRSFLKQTSLGAWALTSGVPLAFAKPSKVPVVDTHLHCFAGTKDKRFPYHKRAPYRPEEPATPQQLLRLMDEAGVDFAVVVHPEPYQDDHRYLQFCLKEGKGRLKGTCLFFSDRPGSVARMPQLVKESPIVAARIHAYAPTRLPPFGKPELKALWKQTADLGLAVQLHFEPRYAPGFEPLIREFSKVTVIVDHLGRPFQGTPKEHDVVQRWARFPNVIMKLSSIPSERQYPHRDVKPILQQLVKGYGPERCIYGGGFNAEATPESYRGAQDRLRSLLSFLSDADQANVLGGNATQLFGWNS